MDAVELARQRAAELFEEGLSQGFDPWDPFQFARSLARSKGWRVEPAKRGAELLEGGRAMLLPDDELILHESEGSPFEQAFLIAHELGHAELGDAKDGSPASNVEPARSSEPSPVGIDRVVDYSRRQRREVQMDLFARELLLPRAVVRRLHLEQGKTCTEIATKLGAPFDVVAQQMLDALLLPQTTGPEPASVLADRPLNHEQRAASGHRGVAYLLQAGPGTGKTKTLVARVEGLLEEGVDPRRILLLTFSNKAAAEMAERIARKHPEAAAAMWAGTFHGFGLDLIRRFNTQLALPADPRLMDRTEAVELIEQEFPRLKLRHYRDLYDPAQVIADLLSAISRAKDEVVDAAHYRRLAEAMVQGALAGKGEALEAAERALEVATVYEAYEAIKRRAACVDFGDLVMLPVQLLERDEAVRTLLQSSYEHVLVDEYQDVNRSSVRLLAALKPDGQNLWVVGDAKQSIYRFRGASAFSLARFGKEDFPGGKSKPLTVNYRSVPEVVSAVATFGTNMKAAQDRAALVPERLTQGMRPELRLVGSGDLVTAAVADAIEESRKRGISYLDQAVLCRGNDKLAEIAQDLERLGIPVLFLGSLFERQEVKDLVALLSLLTDRRAMGLTRVACWPEFSMQLDDVVAIFEHLRAGEAKPGSWAAGCPGLSEAGRTQLAKLVAALDGFDATAHPWTVLATVLLDRTRTAAALASADNVAAQARGIAIWQFMNFVRVQPRGHGLPIVRLMDRMRRLLRLRDERDLRQLPAGAQRIDAVRLMTIHGAKGLEFRVVHLAGVNQDSIPGALQPVRCPPPRGMVEGAAGPAKTPEREMHEQEQECLFYVAASRARDELYLYAATHRANGRRPISPFVGRLGSTLDEKPVAPTRQVPPAPEGAPVPVSFAGMQSFKAQELSLYERCPRRFFYTHLLQVGGRRSASDFMLMHEAVREVFQEVVAASGTPSDSADVAQRLEQAFVRQRLHEHGYVEDYRAIASAMLTYFAASRQGATPVPVTALSLSFGSEQVIVRPDEVLVRGGVRTLRRVQTGHAPRSEPKDVGSAAFLLAARQAFPDAVVELVYLADETAKPLSMSATELTGRQAKVQTMLKDIAGGRFRADRTSYTCSACPAFFICGPVPPGTLHKRA